MTASPRLTITVAGIAAALIAALALGVHAFPEDKPKRVGSTLQAKTEALRNLRTAIVALEAWRVEHNTYAGATLGGLRQYDPDIGDVRVVFATHDDYCLESRVDGQVASKHGPGGDLLLRACGR
jgi:hypothetical protein